jgi:hypothetical protein
MKEPSVNDAVLLRALQDSMREAFSEMLPGVPFGTPQEGQQGNTIGDAAIVALAGQLCGSLLVLTPRASTLQLARRLAGSLVEEDDGQMADNGLLTQLEQDSIRELSNRVGCIFAGAVTAAGRSLSPTFPVFVCGQEISVVAESDYRLGVRYLIDAAIQVEARVFLSPPRPSTSREERIRELERMREELLGGESAR